VIVIVSPVGILMKTDLLIAHEVTKYFPVKGGRGFIHAVHRVSFALKGGQTLGIVGESGCGKSTLARVLLRLIPLTSGKVYLEGVDLARLSARQMRTQRREMQLIFQDAFASLDNRQRIGDIIAEPLVVHQIGSRETRRARVAELLHTVGLEPDAANRYPHEFSGGQRQRIGIARAITLAPKLVIADEPVSALDVSIQSQVLNLLIQLREQLGLAYIFISHDLAVVEHLCDHVAVMYLGEIVEMAVCEDLFSQPLHPYTQALLSAIPRPDPRRRGMQRIVLKGDIPNPEQPPTGCRFHTRCPSVMDVCRAEVPAKRQIESAAAPHIVRCHLYA
jgi:peptide/nickel transport system ATP-binding protein/oligopeptide transport system ATP-binding protein